MDDISKLFELDDIETIVDTEDLAKYAEKAAEKKPIKRRKKKAIIADKVIGPQPGPQTDFLSSKADIVIYGGGAGGGKAQSLDSNICTPDGFKKMGDIKIWDTVCTPNGTAKVLGVFPQGKQDLYRVAFIDGSSTLATLDHLWSYSIARRSRKKLYTDTTAELIEKIKNNNVLIPLTSPVEFKEQDIKIDPYILGCLIGDGCLSESNRRSISFTSEDTEIINRVCVGNWRFKGIECYSRGKTRLHLRKWLKYYGLLGTFLKVPLH